MNKNIIEKFLDDKTFSRLSNTVRWNSTNRIKEETVATHSYIVTLYSRFLAEEIFQDDKNKINITSYALLHDIDEIFTGDILHNVKYNDFNGSKIKSCLDEFIHDEVNKNFNGESKSEELIRKNIFKNFPDYISKIVKVADWLSMYFYLKREIELGNNSVKKERDYCVKSLKLCCKEAISELKRCLHPGQYNGEILIQLKNKIYE